MPVQSFSRANRLAAFGRTAWWLASLWLAALWLGALWGVMWGGMAATAAAAQFHVAPDGQPRGTGSRERPWDLATALAHPAAVQPGDTIWLHDGLYAGSFTSQLRGTKEQPIVVRQLPGARATLDAASLNTGDMTLTVGGRYTWFWGFEVTNSSPQRVAGKGGSDPEGYVRSGSINSLQSEGIKLINLVVHDCSAGPSAWRPAIDCEAYGNLVYNNGWDAPDRGHGHAFYWQNDDGSKRIVDNIVFNQFGHGIFVYGSSRSSLQNVHIEGNICFNNGGLSKKTGYTGNLLVGGGRVAEDIKVLNNFMYYTKGGAHVLGYVSGAERLTARDNYLVAVDGLALQVKATDSTIRGNTFYGHVQGIPPEDQPYNTILTAAQRPQQPEILVRPNWYEPGRAHLAICNWPLADAVEVDLAPAGLNQGDAFEIRDVQDYFGTPVVTAVYDGRPVRISMKDLTISPPVGDAPVTPPHTAPHFAAFVLQRLAPLAE